MTLDKININAYLKFLIPEKPDAAIDEISTRWEKESEDKERDLSIHFIQADSSGKIVTALRTEHASEKEFQIILPTTVVNSKSEQSTVLTNLLEEALTVLKEKGATRINFRVVENLSLRFLSGELPRLGFTQINSRIEYRAKVCDLPESKNSPFAWVDASEGTKYDIKYAAKILEKAGDGNSEWGNWEPNIKVLEEYSSDSEFISDPKNLQIGFINGKAAGIILAQVSQNQGWCTIAYMGLLPEFRGVGFGQWLHQRGFKIMKDLGGVSYHGGTHSDNKAMRALFKKHGCSEFRSMQEWELEF